jgi:regulator of sigma E protease
MQVPVQPWEFRAKPAWQRFMVMIAGVVMNVLLAMMIYSGVCYSYGTSYLANEDVKWGYNFNEAGERMGFKDGDKVISIDDVKIEDVNEIRQMLLLTEGDRSVVVEREGEQQEFTITFDELLAMRREKAYTDLYTLRVPFIIDSVAAPAAVEAGLMAGDEVVACNDRTDIDVVTMTEDILPSLKGSVA